MEVHRASERQEERCTIATILTSLGLRMALDIAGPSYSICASSVQSYSHPLSSQT